MTAPADGARALSSFVIPRSESVGGVRSSLSTALGGRPCRPPNTIVRTREERGERTSFPVRGRSSRGTIARAREECRIGPPQVTFLVNHRPRARGVPR
jgi:hypothetical protein